MFIKRKAQGMLEYTLMLGVVVAIVVAVLFKKGGVGSSINHSYNALGNGLNRTVDDMTTAISPTT